MNVFCLLILILKKYLKNSEAILTAEKLVKEKQINGNIEIRADSTIRFQIIQTLDRGPIGNYQDTVWQHEIVYHTEENIYDESYIIVSSAVLEKNWSYYIVKFWTD